MGDGEGRGKKVEAAERPVSKAFVVEFRVLVESVSSSADLERLKKMSDALESVARDYGCEYVVKEARWT